LIFHSFYKQKRVWALFRPSYSLSPAHFSIFGTSRTASTANPPKKYTIEQQPFFTTPTFPAATEVPNA
jgi:hypothetical protein